MKPPYLRLGEILRSRGLIGEEALEQALEVQGHLGGRLGANLVELGFVTEEQIARCLSDQFHLPYEGTESVAGVAPEIVRRVPREIARRYRCVALREEDGGLCLGLSDPAILEHVEEIQEAAQSRVLPVVLTEVSIDYALDRYYGVGREVRDVRIASLLKGYRWISHVSRGLFGMRNPEQILLELPKLLQSVFEAGSISLVRLDGTSAGEDGPPAARQDLPLEQLAEKAVLVSGGTAYGAVCDDDALSGVLVIQDIHPRAGDLDLLKVILEQVRHALANARFLESKALQSRITSSLGRYVPRSIVEQITRDPDLLPLYGRKRSVSVLFADIRGFTTISEEMDPDVTVMMLNAYLSEMASAVHRFHGMVDKFMGDGLMAFWGAPADVPDFTFQAAQASQEMQRIIPRLNRKLKRHRIEARLRIGIGICTGEALVGNVGSQHLLQYTAIGDVVNVASRLCSQARPGEILVDGTTVGCVGGRLSHELIGPLYVKGRMKEVLVYRLHPSEQGGSKDSGDLR